MFSKSVTYAVWIITMLAPMRGALPKGTRKGGRISAMGLSAAEISKRCGYSGACNLEISRILGIMVESGILRTVYPNGSQTLLYTLIVDLEKISLCDLVNMFDYGVRIGEPDIHREWTDNFIEAPELKNYKAISGEIKQDVNRMLQNIPISVILDNSVSK